jgi:hypothetical protein
MEKKIENMTVQEAVLFLAEEEKKKLTEQFRQAKQELDDKFKRK